MIDFPPWISAQLPPDGRRRMVDVGDDLQMHVQEWGPPEGRAVLLLHGNPTWSFLWRKVVAAVRAPLRLIAPDLIGLGCSSKPRDLTLHTLPNHSRWLGRALDAVAPRQPMVFVGQDWGGPIGMHAFLARADQLRGIVLGNTSISPPAPTSKRTLFHRLSQLPIASDLLFRGLGFPLQVLHTSQGDRGSIRGDVARAYRWPLEHVADRAAPLALARMVPDSPRHPSVAELARTEQLFATSRAPKHLVWGVRDPILGRAITHLSQLAPDIVVTRTNAGHFLQEEVPDALADAITDVAARASWS
jgi:haloalkane dehalogenase